MDAYKERTIELMKKNGFDDYLKNMCNITIPTNNLIYLVLSKVHDFEQAANEEILKEASARRAEQERRRLADV